MPLRVEADGDDLVVGLGRDVVDAQLGGVVRDEGHRHALALGPAGAADAVDVVLVLVGDVAVEDDVHVVHVDAPGRHVRGDEDGDLPLAEAVHDLLPALLGDVPVDALGVDAPHLQELADALGVALGVAEGHAAVKAGLLQDLRDGVGLLVAGHLHAELLDVGLVLLVRPDGDLLGVPLVDPGDVHDLPGDGGGEEPQVLALIHPVQQPGHVVDEAHVQHPVRLVQHHGLGGVHPDGAALHVVGEAAGGGHHDLGVLFQGVDLLADGRAAVEADGADAGSESGEVPQLLRDLDGQLPRGGQDHGLHALVLRVDVLHDGDAVGKGLAGAGGGLGHHVLPLHHGGDAPGLHRGGELDAPLLQGLHDLR